MKYILKTNHRNIPDKELLNDLRKSAKMLGKLKISKREYQSKGTYDDSTLTRRFGSWNKAVLKARLEINKPANVAELMDNLKHVWDTLKRQPTSKDMVKPLSKYSNYAYVWIFGSWSAALKEFVKLHSKHGKRYRGLIKTNASSGKIKNKIQCNVSKTMRFDVMLRDKFKCRLCGASPAVNPKVTLHADHIIPRSKNGETSISNLQTLCSDCNYGKGTKSIAKSKACLPTRLRNGQEPRRTAMPLAWDAVAGRAPGR